MSFDRIHNRNGPLKPALASTRTPRAPIAPRIAGGGSLPPRVGTLSPTASIQSAPGVINSRPKPHDAPARSSEQLSQVSDSSTARLYVRGLKGDSSVSLPTQLGKSQSPRVTPSRPQSGEARASPNTGLGVSHGVQARVHGRTPTQSDRYGSVGYPLAETQGVNGTERTPFFHANDVKKLESPLPKPEIKKAPAFVYADGKQERLPNATTHAESTRTPSTVSDIRTGLRFDPEFVIEKKASPVASPGISNLSDSSPYFAMPLLGGRHARSPSPSKESIHLSYRRGASQIFGTRPASRIALSEADEYLTSVREEQSLKAGQSQSHAAHQKSSSLSSIDSGPSSTSRRRSATSATGASSDPTTPPVESRVSPVIAFSKPAIMHDLPSIDTSLENDEALAEPISPTKGSVDFATEARRERKVLDLEISNSSLLAINASLERELRRQKTELKRFRRLSRAGRFSSRLSERSVSEDMSTLDEDMLGEMDAEHMTGLLDPYDDLSDAESESVVSGEPFSPHIHDGQEQDRLARDEKRLRIDLQRHRELLVQSQMMNQSIQRCMYATEEMITDGRKALAYQVDVSEIKLGGRILTGHEDDDHEGPHVMPLDISISESQRASRESLPQSDTDDTDISSAQQLLQVWQGVGRPSLESSESGDRDSGIEVEKAISAQMAI